jgi:DNA-binding NtrC family response regulator
MQNLAQVFLEQLKLADVPGIKNPTRYLVVDDDLQFGQTMKELLTFCNPCLVDVVNAPDAAVSSVAQTIPYSRVFLDLNFPGKESGIVAMKKIRAIMPDTPITIVSGAIGEVFSDFVEEAKKYNISVLEKGFTINALMDVL